MPRALVLMKPSVDIQGAGRLLTTITAPGADDSLEASATVTGASDTKLRDLTVANTGGAAFGVAFYASVPPSQPRSRIYNVRAMASNAGDSRGIHAQGAVDILSSEAMASGGDLNVGIFISLGNGFRAQSTLAEAEGGIDAIGFSSVATVAEIAGLITRASGATHENVGMLLHGDNTEPSRIMGLHALASGGERAVGIRSSLSAALLKSSVVEARNGSLATIGLEATFVAGPTLHGVDLDARSEAGEVIGLSVSNVVLGNSWTDVRAVATGGTAAFGIHSTESMISAAGTEAIADGAIQNFGFYHASATNPRSARLVNSRLQGETATIRGGSNITISVGGSHLDGGPVDTSAGGTVTCAGVYDETFTFSPSVCP